MRFLLAILLIIAVSSVSLGATYEWVDNSGVTHFTDDPDSIPAKYRKRVEERESIKAEPAGMPSEQRSPPEAAPPPPLQPSLYGGRSEAEWRSMYKGVREQMKAIQDSLPAKKEKLNEIRRHRVIYQKPSDRVAYNNLSQEIQGDEARISELQGRLDDLDKEATRAGIPQEWRQ